MEISVLVLGVLFERARPDLRVRRWWARHGWTPPGTRLAVPVPVALAGVDARRLLLRPTTLFVAYVLWRLVTDRLPRGAYDGVNSTVGFAWAFVGVLAIVLVASLAGRDRGEEIVGVTPRGERAPVSSWIVLLLCAGLLEYGLAAVRRWGHSAPESYAALMPDAWELAQVPLMLIGGGLLGLIAARLVPAWVAAPLTMILGITWVGVFSANLDLAMLAPVIDWIEYHEDGRVVVEPGSFGWHNAYLLGLCGLGAVAALMTTPGRRRPLLLAGTAFGVGTVVAGVLALP
ncbi:MAG TPA: hypothetical protein VM097_03645 [Mycobacteriales bacterium]|nr:hypothetical protein [Mycobacteriales bacterium]